MANVFDPVVENCCGCAVCAEVCPKGAIAMMEDSEGFMSPVLDASLCVDCSLCVKSCPALNKREPSVPIAVYAAKNRDDVERRKSSSGGLFLPVAREILSRGGVVFGAAFADGFTRCVHSVAEDEDALSAFSGSKYLQSETSGIYAKVRWYLKEGRPVLYSGTPCQIAALRSFLKKDYDGLYCVDVVCHSVPSPGVWRRYFSELGLKDVAVFRFRDKITGWKLFSLTATDSKGRLVFSQREDDNVYMNGFLKDLYCRKSCHDCFARRGMSGSDLTIADFWKLKKSHPEFDDNVGVGLAIVRTEKGMELFNSGNFNFIGCTYQEALYGNPALEKDSRPHPCREDFFTRYREGKRIVPYVRRKTSPKLSRMLKGRLRNMTSSLSIAVNKMKKCDVR